MKLYYAPGACSFVPHALLESSGANFEPIWVRIHKGEHRSPEFLAINPRGQVPVLVDQGHAIDQVVAIVLHIEAAFPDAGLLPKSGLARTRALRTLLWMNNTAHPTFTHAFMPSRFTDDPDAQSAVRDTARVQYAQRLRELQEMVKAAAGEWLSGAAFGPLDAYTLTLTRWGGIAGIDPTTYPELWTHVQRVAALPAVARVIERERLQLNLFQA